MTQHQIIEHYGFTLKQEHLVNVNAKCFTDTLVLETTEPFPGYYEFTNYPAKEKLAKTLFLVTEKLYDLAEVQQITDRLYQEYKEDFGASPGTLEVDGETYNCIRIYDFHKYSSVLELQSRYALNGVEYKCSTKKVNGRADIKIHKRYHHKQLAEGIFQDAVYTDQYFIAIPDAKYTLDNFKSITRIVKSNVELHFDAALTTLECDTGRRWFVRYFDGSDDNIELEKLSRLKALYIKSINEVLK